MWPDPPTSWRRVSKKHLAPVSAEAYMAYGGRVIVRTTREGQAKLSQPGPAKASPVATPANPPGSSVGSTGAAGGSGGNVWPQAVPPPSDRHQRLILKAMSRLGVAVTKSNLASAMGLQACPADAMDALVKSGLVQSRENKSGRLEFFLTEGGVSAAFEIHRQERT